MDPQPLRCSPRVLSKKPKGGTTLFHADAKVQTATILALMKLGEPDRKTVDRVSSHLMNISPQVRLAALLTLGSFGDRASDTTRQISQHFQSISQLVRVASLEAAVSIGESVEDITTSLGVAVVQSNGGRAHQAALALTNLGVKSRLVLPALLYTLGNEQWTQVHWTRDRPKGALAPGAWKPFVESPSFHETRLLMVTLVTKIALAYPEDAELIRPILARAAGDSNAEVAAAAQEALGRF